MGLKQSQKEKFDIYVKLCYISIVIKIFYKEVVDS